MGIVCDTASRYRSQSLCCRWVITSTGCSSIHVTEVCFKPVCCQSSMCGLLILPSIDISQISLASSACSSQAVEKYGPCAVAMAAIKNAVDTKTFPLLDIPEGSTLVSAVLEKVDLHGKVSETEVRGPFLCCQHDECLHASMRSGNPVALPLIHAPFVLQNAGSMLSRPIRSRSSRCSCCKGRHWRPALRHTAPLGQPRSHLICRLSHPRHHFRPLPPNDAAGMTARALSRRGSKVPVLTRHAQPRRRQWTAAGRTPRE